MPTGPAARVLDNVIHPLPPVLTGGPGSPDVLIGYLPAWRGVGGAGAAALQAARTMWDVAVTTAETATKAAAGTPAAPAALAAEVKVKADAVASLGGAISASGADVHQCITPSPPTTVVHGPGVVIDGSATVTINYLPACRLGDTVLEALGPPNKIVKGEPTVIIGG
jgi:uncharacterized Zn-binding protein involved in type VI secretion